MRASTAFTTACTTAKQSSLGSGANGSRPASSFRGRMCLRQTVPAVAASKKRPTAWHSKGDVRNVECSICSKKGPLKPMKCTCCKQWVGCGACVLGWARTQMQTDSNITCPLCRSTWYYMEKKVLLSEK